MGPASFKTKKNQISKLSQYIQNNYFTLEKEHTFL